MNPVLAALKAPSAMCTARQLSAATRACAEVAESDPNRTSTGRFCCDALCVAVMERFGPQGREEKMGRKFIDCREFPSEMNCTLALSADNEDELLEAAVQHAITVHGHEDTPDLRTMIRTAMRDGTPPVEAPRRAA